MRIREIADEHGIPPRFLVQILLQLKGAGYVASTRGASGGYQLIKPPAKISLGEVMAVIEGEEDHNNTPNAKSPTARVLARTWQEMGARQHAYLRSITFADLAERTKGVAEQMYYI